MNINLAINEGSKILKSKFIPSPLLDSEISDVHEEIVEFIEKKFSTKLR